MGQQRQVASAAPPERRLHASGAYFTHGPGIVFNTKRPITKVEDLQGLKWRVGGGMVNEIS